MPASNTVLRIAELDFDQIKINLKEYLRSQSEFTDFDFEGSGMNILLDVLAYNTHYMSYYLNMVGNEAFLDSSTIRSSVVSHAKHLNYLPNSFRAASAFVDIVITDDDNLGSSSYTLPQFSVLQSQQIDGTNYTFVTPRAYTAAKNLTSSTYTFPAIQIIQGERLTYNVSVSADNTKRRFLIPSANVDTTTLDVVVRESSEDTAEQIYSLADDTLNITSNSTVYFLEEDPSGQYAIYFGDGYIGKNLDDGNIVQLSYVDTSGDASNKVNSFTMISETSPFSNVIVRSISASAGGADKESIERIKYTAPKFYTTQNRAVTVSDYEVILSKDYPNIQAASIWGGEENTPVEYGKVFISLVPKAGYVITDLEKRRIIRELLDNRNVVTVTPQIVDPDYLYIKLEMNVNHDDTKTILDDAQLEVKVRQQIEDYSVNDLEKFNSTFRQSKLQKMIDGSDNSILSSDMKVILQKRIEPTLDSSKNYTIEFNTPIKRGTYKDRIYSYPPFVVQDADGVSREAAFEETPLSFTGVSSISVTNAGYGYTVPPRVIITGDGSGARAKAEIVNGKVNRIIVTSRGANYTSAVVTFDGDGSAAAADVTLSSQVGSLRTYYIQAQTGEKIIINEEAGVVNYATGTINLINFKPLDIVKNPNYDYGILTINAETDDGTIYPKKNRILLIDNLDPVALNIRMVRKPLNITI